MKTGSLDNFLKLLRGERSGGVVWTADLAYWISGRQADGTADPAWQTEGGYLDLHRSLGVMPYYYMWNACWNSGKASPSCWAWPTRCRRTEILGL